MTWTYAQASGAFALDGKILTTGYSGFGAAKNNPAAEAEINRGPVPLGRYRLSEPYDSESHGPVCFHLTPAHETRTFGRCGFLIHGDSIECPGSASHGCIILDRATRLLIAQSPVRDLEVA